MRQLSLLVIVAFIFPAGCGGSSSGGRAVPAVDVTSMVSLEVDQQREATSLAGNRFVTVENTPIEIEFMPPDPGSVLKTTWLLPQTGDLEFIGKRFAARYVPPPGYTGTTSFEVQLQRTDGSTERNNIQITVKS
jgi:hypothetical protein